MSHTPTPWNKQHKLLDTTTHLLTDVDYQRAKVCVNACDGMEDPHQWLEEVASRLDSVTKDTLTVLAAKNNEIAQLKAKVEQLEERVSEYRKLYNDESEVSRILRN